MVTSFLHLEVFGTSCTIFSMLSYSYKYHGICNEKSSQTFISSCLLKYYMLDGVFERKILEFFVILNEHYLNHEVFKNIEEISKICYEYTCILGQCVVEMPATEGSSNKRALAISIAHSNLCYWYWEFWQALALLNLPQDSLYVWQIIYILKKLIQIKTFQTF